MVNELVNAVDVISRSLGDYIKEGEDKEFDVCGIKFRVSKKDGVVSTTAHGEFSDGEGDVKERNGMCRYFKEMVRECNKDVFMRTLDEVRGLIDLHEFDRLLEKPEMSSAEFAEFRHMADIYRKVLMGNVEKQIVELQEFRERY